MGRNFTLESSWNRFGGGEEKNQGKKKKEKKREVRSSTFSLRFMEIGPSVFVGARGKVHLRDESFA